MTERERVRNVIGALEACVDAANVHGTDEVVLHVDSVREVLGYLRKWHDTLVMAGEAGRAIGRWLLGN